jgi:hypothetical protein
MDSRPHGSPHALDSHTDIMPFKMNVRTEDAALQATREASALSVVNYFGQRVHSTDVLCFFDCEDSAQLRHEYSEVTRGFYQPLKGYITSDTWRDTYQYWPGYLRDLLFVSDPDGFPPRSTYRGLIYLFGSTCQEATGLTMTFAHELQHLMQHERSPRLWVANTLLTNLPATICNLLGLKYFDVPTEREAMIVAKHCAEAIHGADRVAQFIQGQVAKASDGKDRENWQFIRTIPSETHYELASETRILYSRLRPYRKEIETLLDEARSFPDYNGIEVDDLFSESDN